MFRDVCAISQVNTDPSNKASILPDIHDYGTSHPSRDAHGYGKSKAPGLLLQLHTTYPYQ